MRIELVLAALLAAGPAQAGKALVNLDAKIVKAAGLEAKGYDLIDVSREHGQLQGELVAVLPDEPAPAWATEAMRKDWADGTAACRAKVGPPPYAGDMKAVFCGQDLAKALWQRHLERFDPRGIVLAGGFFEDDTAKNFPVSVVGYRVDETQLRALSGKAKNKDEALKMASSFVLQIIEGGGEPTKRDIVRQLPRAPAGSSPRSEVAQFKPAEVPAGCSPLLPRRLEITSTNPRVAADLDRLYGVSVKEGGAPSRPCTLEYEQGSDEVATTTVFLGKGRLSCDAERFEGAGTSFMVSAVEELVLKDLLEKAFGAWCARK